MTTINPNLASAALTLQNQQSPVNAKSNNQTIEDTSTSPKTTAGGNSQVTLSENPADKPQDYLEIHQSQVVKEKDSAETGTSQQNQTASELTYSASLQNNSNYLQTKPK